MDTDTSENDYEHKTFRVTSDAIRFTMSMDSLTSDEGYLIIDLFAEECPHKKLYRLCFDFHRKTLRLKIGESVVKIIQMPNFLLSLQPQKFWLSWYNECFRLGLVDKNTLLEYQHSSQRTNDPIVIGPRVGFITFKNIEHVSFEIKDPLVITSNIFKQIDGGELKWVQMNSGDPLPMEALIGGFQGEPIYIARAKHKRSICPGKYIPSKQLAFVPWGHREHTKSEFEVLCGYNVMWIKCKSPYLPGNVFVAGKSEVRNDPLYIGRAMIDDDLVVGKVHMLYQLCYLPYHGREVSKSVFEVLAVGNSADSEDNWKKQCCMVNCRQPCP